jgi:hypothetical protein
MKNGPESMTKIFSNGPPKLSTSGFAGSDFTTAAVLLDSVTRRRRAGDFDRERDVIKSRSRIGAAGRSAAFNAFDYFNI